VLGATLLASVLGGIYLLTFVNTPYVIENPGKAFDVLGTDAGVPVIEISDAKTYPTTGRLDLLTVMQQGNPERTPSWAEVIQAWLDPSKAVLPIDQVYPQGQTAQEAIAEASAMMEGSQQEAIAAALTHLGYEVNPQAYVASIVKGGAAEGLLHADDLILRVNGNKITNITELRAQVSAWKGGKPLSIEVKQPDNRISIVEVTPKKVEGALRIGVMVGTKYEFPLDVKLQLADVGGPSGGMMFALGIIDELTPGSLTGGYHIAGTGTITRAGEVGAIGGIRQKLYSAQNAGATWFLAPASNCNEVVGHIPDGINVVKVSTLRQALDALDRIAAGKQTESLPTCSASK
jgi:PDZ domain-containing protein